MYAPAPQNLSLPEEFVLLSHLPSGRVHGSPQAVIGCAAAELGELALRGRLLVRSRKSTAFGVEVHRLHGVDIELLNTAPTGLTWADGVLTELARHCEAGTRRLRLHRWFRQHHQAFSLHRSALTERGVLHHEPGSLFARERHYPLVAARDSLIMEIRAVRAEQVRLDGRLLLLGDLVRAVGLDRKWGAPLTLRQQWDRGRGRGMAQSLPEALRDTSTALAAALPNSKHDTKYGRPRI